MKHFLLKTSSHTGLLIGRILVGAFMLFGHGMPKLIGFNELLNNFGNPIGLGAELSFLLILFAEVVCSVCLIFGAFTRIAVVPLIIGMLVAAFVAHSADPFVVQEKSLLYAATFLLFFFTGPGKYSVDYALFKKRF